MTRRTYIIGLITTIVFTLILVFFPPTISTSVIRFAKIAVETSDTTISIVVLASLLAFLAALVGIITSVYDATVQEFQKGNEE